MLKETLLREMTTLNKLENCRKSAEDIFTLAGLYAMELKKVGETNAQTVADAYEFHKHNASGWLQLSTLLGLLDKVRRPTNRVALPEAEARTEGLSLLAEKFWKEGRSSQEFDFAADRLREFKNAHSRERITAELLNNLFGNKSLKRTSLVARFKA